MSDFKGVFKNDSIQYLTYFVVLQVGNSLVKFSPQSSQISCPIGLRVKAIGIGLSVFHFTLNHFEKFGEIDGDITIFISFLAQI